MSQGSPVFVRTTKTIKVNGIEQWTDVPQLAVPLIIRRDDGYDDDGPPSGSVLWLIRDPSVKSKVDRPIYKTQSAEKNFFDLQGPLKRKILITTTIN